MGSKEDMKSLDSTLKDLSLSSDEVEKFDKAFKDPTFAKLFLDYAKEISSPEARKEQEEYLRQIETEGNAESVYGKGVQLIVPDPGFVVKTRDKKSKQKMFINICTSDKIEVAKSHKATNELGQKGLSWEIPSSAGTVKKGKDKRGQQCGNMDFIVNPLTFQMAQTNQPFKRILAEMAMERMEAQDSNLDLNQAFSTPKMLYHGIDGSTKPSVLAVRTGKGGECQNGYLKPQANNEVDKKLKEAINPDVRTSRSRFCFDRSKNTKIQPKDPKEPGFKHPSGEVTPHFEILESSSVDMANAWQDPNLQLSSYPRRLSIRVHLPNVYASSEACLDVTTNNLKLIVPSKYKLDVDLPYSVDATKGKAKFLKTASKMQITLPTIPPPSQKVLAVENSETDNIICEETAAPVKEKNQELEGCKQVHDSTASKQESCEACDNFDAADKPDSKDLNFQHTPKSEIFTENQRKWMEIHSAKHMNGVSPVDTSDVRALTEATKADVPLHKEDSQLVSEAMSDMKHIQRSSDEGTGGESSKKATIHKLDGFKWRLKPIIKSSSVEELD